MSSSCIALRRPSTADIARLFLSSRHVQQIEDTLTATSAISSWSKSSLQNWPRPSKTHRRRTASWPPVDQVPIPCFHRASLFEDAPAICRCSGVYIVSFDFLNLKDPRILEICSKVITINYEA